MCPLSNYPLFFEWFASLCWVLGLEDYEADYERDEEDEERRYAPTLHFVTLTKIDWWR